MPAGAKLTKAQRVRREERIIKDIKAGKLSYRLIAEKNGVSLPTVNNKARKAGVSRGRRKGATILVSGPRRGPSKTTARKAPARTTRTRAAAPSRATRSGFGDSFRELILAHYPNISLKDFDKLNRLVESAVA